MFFTSLITPLILLVLYGTFLSNVYEDTFRSAMEGLGAAEIRAGDAGYEISLMDGFQIRFQLWGGDEEFPPSSQILFSDNFPAAFHAEDLVVACDVIIGTMKHV